MKPQVLKTDLPLPIFRKGKVRDVYDLGENLLIVATDRISAYDVVLPTGIPGKGVILNQMSLFWLKFLQAENHLLSADIKDYPKSLANYGEILAGRSMLVKKCVPVEIECIVRGYLAGSGWKDYQKTGAVCGIKLPPGLKEAERLAKPLFTPSTKAHTGHDENISFEETKKRIGENLANILRDLSVSVYEKGARHAEENGLILADTKFEFGLSDGAPILIDEVLTPDSSRFWLKENWRPGSAPQNFDKQFVRDYLDSVNWNRKPPAPDLPREVAEKTQALYLEAFRRLTGKVLKL